MTITAVSLFDGIGGFPLALSRAGVATVATVEIDAACRGVTERNLPPHKQFTDVQEVTGGDLIGAGFGPETGIVTAGWPCQGNSVAGGRGGMDDPRSGLWWEVVRVLRETRPRWFLGENVPGLLTIHGGLDFWLVKESLEELGYGLAWRVLDAQHFGVPQRRKRVFVVGCLGDGADPAQVLLEPESGTGGFAAGSEAGPQTAGAAVVSTLQGGGKRGYRIDAEAAAGGHLIPFDAVQITSRENRSNPQPGDPVPTLSQTSRTYVTEVRPADGYNGNCGEPGGPMYALSTKSDHNRSLALSALGVRRLTPRECERLQGFPDDWTAGQSDSARYRQLGNAVAVPCVEWIARRIAHLNSTSNREAA